MIREALYFLLATFTIILLYKILVPVWITFTVPFDTVAGLTITDTTFSSGLSALQTDITNNLNYTFVGMAVILGIYLAIVAIKREGEQYSS